MKSKITIKGYVGKIEESSVKGKPCIFINLATNLYNYDDNKTELDDTIWSRFVYYGDFSNIQVGMPLFIEGHLTPNKGKTKSYRSFNFVADYIGLDLANPKATQYLKDI